VKVPYADRDSRLTIQGKKDRLQVVLDIFSRYNSKRNFDRILDARCGDGSFSKLLKEVSNAKEVYGFEFYENKVKLARTRGIMALQIDLDEEDFPFEDNYFDAICAIDIIEHLYDPDHFLEEIYRTLKPNGLFIVATPNLASIHNRIALLLGFQPFCINLSLRCPIGHIYKIRGEKVPPSSHHFRVFTLRSLKEILKHHKFSIDEVKGAGAVLPDDMPFYKFFRALEEFISNFPFLSYEVVILCKKEDKQ